MKAIGAIGRTANMNQDWLSTNAARGGEQTGSVCDDGLRCGAHAGRDSLLKIDDHDGSAFRFQLEHTHD
jgi:hypothetical protein